jgi:hypothetical protein
VHPAQALGDPQSGFVIVHDRLMPTPEFSAPPDKHVELWSPRQSIKRRCCAGRS